MKLSRLEALRGFAAFYVVLHHSFPHSFVVSGWNLGYLFRFGPEMVVLFFLISGFVINYSCRNGRDKSFKTYLTKRLTRIYIPLLVVLVLAYFLACWRTGSVEDPQANILMLNLLMLQDLGFVKPGVIVEPYLGNSPLWSLSYEWWFYVLYFPIVKWIPGLIWRDRLVYGVALLAACWYLVSPDFGSRLLMYLLIWWAGVVLSDKYMDHTLSFQEIGLLLVTVTAVTAMLAVNAGLHPELGGSARLGAHPVLEFRHFMFASLSIVCSLIWRKYRWIGFDLLFKPFLVLAPISYTLYISHYPLVVEAQYLSWINIPALEWFIYFLLACLFCYLVEVKMYPWCRTLVFRRLKINGRQAPVPVQS